MRHALLAGTFALSVLTAVLPAAADPATEVPAAHKTAKKQGMVRKVIHKGNLTEIVIHDAPHAKKVRQAAPATDPSAPGLTAARNNYYNEVDVEPQVPQQRYSPRHEGYTQSYQPRGEDPNRPHFYGPGAYAMNNGGYAGYPPGYASNGPMYAPDYGPSYLPDYGPGYGPGYYDPGYGPGYPLPYPPPYRSERRNPNNGGYRQSYRSQPAANRQHTNQNASPRTGTRGSTLALPRLSHPASAKPAP